MSIDLTGRLYKVDNRVYLGYNQVVVHNQRGRLFIKYKGRQINIKEIPVKPDEEDCVFNYIFGGQFKTHPCSAMEYWIYRHRMGNKITISQYKEKFKVHERTTKAIPILNKRKGG